MKICSYNIWNSDTNFKTRLDLLVKEINDKDIDIIALQEVKDKETFEYIKKKSEFEFGFFFKGLAFLSNYDIRVDSTFSDRNNYMIRVVFKDTSFTNIHLDWENSDNRLDAIDEYFGMLDEKSYENEFILGDFNDTPEELIHFDLVMSDFIDIHQTYAHSKNEVPLPTLDMHNNPRWRHIKTDETPSRFDWIMLYTKKEYVINDVSLIGREEINEITPSDHYGLLANIDIEI